MANGKYRISHARSADSTWHVARGPMHKATRHTPRVIHSWGFSLIEVMVVVAIFGIIVSIGTNIFINILRSNTKVTLLSQIREDGTRAIEAMARSFENAAKIIEIGSPASCPPYVIVQNKQQSSGATGIPAYTRYSIFSFSSGTNNGFIAIDSNNTLATLQAITSANATPITNKSGNTAVDIDPTSTACINVTQVAGPNGQISIVSPVFTLQQSKNVVLGRKEKEAKVPFQTTFSLRVY